MDYQSESHPAIVINGDVAIPDWVVDHESYSPLGALSDEFPETGRYSFLNGTIWVDLTMEQFFSHNQVKTEYCSVLRYVVKRNNKSGYFGNDGNLWTNIEAGDFDGTRRYVLHISCLAIRACSADRREGSWIC